MRRAEVRVTAAGADADAPPLAHLSLPPGGGTATLRFTPTKVGDLAVTGTAELCPPRYGAAASAAGATSCPVTETYEQPMVTFRVAA